MHNSTKSDPDNFQYLARTSLYSNTSGKILKNICMAFHLSTQLAFNESSVQRLRLTCTSNIVHLHSLHMKTLFEDILLLKQLHWLPIEWRMRFKLATLTFKALHTGSPPYFSDLLQHHEHTRSLCSSSSHQLLVSHHNLSFRSHAF